MREAGVEELLKTLVAQKRSSGDDTAKRAQSALAKFELQRDSSMEDMRWSTTEVADALSSTPIPSTNTSTHHSRTNSNSEENSHASAAAVPDNRMSVFDPEAHFADFVDSEE